MSKNRVNRKQKNSYSKIFTAIGNQQIAITHGRTINLKKAERI